jgi:hypothetical protein
MTIEDILQSANEDAPELMEKTAAAFYYLDKTNPEFSDELAEEVRAITDFTKEKIAGAGDAFAKGVADVGKGVAVTVGAGVSLALAQDIYDAARRAVSKSRNFNRIMEADPSLKKEFSKENLQKAFSMLHRYAPEFTADPTVGAGLLRNISEDPSRSAGNVLNLIGPRSQLVKIKSRQWPQVNVRDSRATSEDIERLESQLADKNVQLRGKQIELQNLQERLNNQGRPTPPPNIRFGK